MAVFSSARNTNIPPSLSAGDEINVFTEGRSLMASLEDYNEPTANRGHDPPSRSIGGGGGNGGRGRSRKGRQL
ncbi:hypothetical protein CCACVL1_10856 [Corchorus capsularis]|uniref:Uncharacterized protein n=1 Tax=Corchorus capsularis TaxID=210143 RepID=A0A1R3IP73_COCAP|nr:hypothetical protein CCACVL1_10856 [Corchorus capsularis]